MDFTTFKELEKLRKEKLLDRWELAFMLGLRPGPDTESSVMKFCSVQYAHLKSGKRKIDRQIVLAAQRLAGMYLTEIQAKLSRSK